eukprot:COSAG01_NODE_4475_length_4988_cov_16.399264_4_plen_279_part_00
MLLSVESDLFNDHHVVRLRDVNWAEPRLRWEQPPADGTPPLPRAGHTAAAVGSTIYIFGGSGQMAHSSGRRFLNDVHALDTRTNEWRRCTCGGAVPPARAGHALVEKAGNMYIVGGADAKSLFSDVAVLNVNRMEKFAVEEGDDLPSGSVLYVPGLERKLKKREPGLPALPAVSVERGADRFLARAWTCCTVWCSHTERHALAWAGMKKTELVQRNILKERPEAVGGWAGREGVGGGGGGASHSNQQWWAAHAALERNHLDRKLGCAAHSFALVGVIG